MTFAGKRYWLVGASEGLGRALAHDLSRQGANVALSARSEERLTALADELPGEATVHPLDVQDLSAVRDCVARLGPIDGVIVMQGVYWPMTAAEFDPEQVELMFDVNLTGTARVLSYVLPDMMRRDQGHVVIVGSLSGFRGLPGAVGYGASKAGMMHLAENLRAETQRTNVKVQLMNPGFIRTRLTDKNDFTMPFLMDPEEAADHITRAMGTNRFQTNFPRVFSWLFRGSNFLPAALYYRLFGSSADRRPKSHRGMENPAE
ncbi:MAG: SDR family NAD(P)-dependent oxidoreductase [Pseudomonadota bacterium]